MTRKTRRQKRLANARKQAKSRAPSIQSTSTIQSTDVPTKISPQIALNATQLHEEKDAHKETRAPRKISKYEYKESEYDRELRKYTKQDIMKTGAIIVGLFVLQYIIYLKFAPGN